MSKDKDPFGGPTILKDEEPKVGVNFTSNESKKIFLDSMLNNTANPFFELQDKFITQTFIAYCGPANISIILNSIGIDPKVVFFRNWRWYSESNIHSLDIEGVRNHGMVLPDLAFLIQDNGVNVKLYRTICENNKNLENKIDINLLNDEKKYKKLILYDDLSKIKGSSLLPDVLKNLIKNNKNYFYFNLVNLDFFRTLIYASCYYDNFFMVLNVFRNDLGQNGWGHYMPAAAYNLKDDYVLILDCGRFKYNSRWQKVDLVFKSLDGVDSATKNTRGFVTCEKIIKKKILNVGQKEIKNINEEKLNQFIKLLKFDDLKDKAKVINWLMINEIKVDGDFKNSEEIWEKVVKNVYEKEKKFRDFLEFLFMFDRINLKRNILGCVVFCEDLNNSL